MIHIRNVSKSFGDKDVLHELSFAVNRGETLGLLGPNGSGKSTLLRIIAGVERPEDGSVALSPPSLRLGYLPQGLAGDSGLTVRHALPELERRFELEDEVSRLAASLAQHREARPDVADAYAAALEKLAEVSTAVEARLSPIMGEWGLEELDGARALTSLSGGEQTRLGLARLMSERNDVLLLDEPTNHLDISGIEALEAWLGDFDGAVVLVTHDRALLSRLPTSILDLSPDDGSWRLFSGTYATFLETKERELRQTWETFGRQQRESRKVEQKIDRLKRWAERIENETIDFHYRKRAARIARQAKTTEQRLRRFLDSENRVDRPNRVARLRPEVPGSQRSGDDVLSVEGLCLEIGGRVLFQDASFGLRYGDRAVVFGPNGCGKTSLLRAIVGRLKPKAGSVRLGAGVREALLEQGQEGWEPELNAIQTLRPLATLDEGALRRFLHHYLFTAADVHTPVAKLSSGQRARLSLAKLALQGVNFLLLDEPTNHLDIESREAFEQALDEFKGTVLLVSHDRYFVESYATQVLRIEDGTVHEYHLRV